MAEDLERTEDGRWIVVRGRRWRAEDPELDPKLTSRLRSHLGRARAAVRTARTESARRSARERVQLAKEGLGERGTAWWELPASDRARRGEDRLSRLDALTGQDEQGGGSSTGKRIGRLARRRR